MGYGSFIGKTDFGFKVKYRVACGIWKIDSDDFKAARMLEPGRFDDLVEEWHRKVFLPKFTELGCSFKFLIGRNWFGPQLCRAFNDGKEMCVGFDPSFIETLKEMQDTPFRSCGCIIRFVTTEFCPDETIAKENYDMIKRNWPGRPLETPEYREWEEQFVATCLHQRFELERTLQNVQANQKHKSAIISVSTQLAGCAVELAWNISNYENSDYLLRGYRSETGLAPLDRPSDQGACIAETRANGRAAHHLNEGKEYFYTFLLTRERPIYANRTFVQSLFSSPTVERTETEIVDSLRFSIRAPTQMEILHAERMMEKIRQEPPESARSTKMNKALEELTSFVEFDESMSKWEQDLIGQIKSKRYPAEEERDKIERLKGLVGSLRVQ